MPGFQQRSGAPLGTHIIDCLFKPLLPSLAAPLRMPTSGPPCTHLRLHGHPNLPHGQRAHSWDLPHVAPHPAVQGPCACSPGPHPPTPPGGQAEGLRGETRKAKVSTFPFPLFPHSLACTPCQEPRSNGIFSLQLPLVM